MVLIIDLKERRLRTTVASVLIFDNHGTRVLQVLVVALAEAAGAGFVYHNCFILANLWAHAATLPPLLLPI